MYTFSCLLRTSWCLVWKAAWQSSLPDTTSSILAGFLHGFDLFIYEILRIVSFANEAASSVYLFSLRLKRLLRAVRHISINSGWFHIYYIAFRGSKAYKEVKCRKSFWPTWGSNPRPSRYQHDALTNWANGPRRQTRLLRTISGKVSSRLFLFIRNCINLSGNCLIR